MRLLGIALAFATATGTLAATDVPRFRDRETARATDLSRAKRMADRAASRLRTPAAPSRGWVHGGDGWTKPDAARPADDAPSRVVVNVRPPRRRRHQVGLP